MRQSGSDIRDSGIAVEEEEKMKKYNPLRNDIKDILKAFERSNSKTDKHESNRGLLVLSGLTYKRGHVFPNPDELFVLAQECNLQFHRALGLILKGQWERGFACDKNGWPAKATRPFTDVLSDAVEHTPEAINFNPDTAELFAMIQRNGNKATQAGYGAADFDTLLQQMILAGLHISRNNGPEMARFAETETDRQTTLRDSTAVQREDFWRKRCRWGQAQEMLDDLHMQIEQRRLKNAETKRQYLALFGATEVELQEAMVRWWELKLWKDLKEANPSLTEEELTELAIEAENRHGKRRELEKLRDAAMLAPILTHEGASGTHMDVDQVREYRAQTKSLLRKLRFKIHPDRLRNDPAYQKLTAAQKGELETMLKQALEISFSELGFPPGFAEHDMRSVRGLEEALARVNAILGNAGLDTRVEAQIQGRTLADQLEWLQRTIMSLERRLDEAKAELHALATDPETQRVRNVLACPEQHETIREAMAGEAGEYNAKADKLEEEIKPSFATKESEGDS